MSPSLPDRPNLKHLKDQAHTLLKQHKAGQAAACEPLRCIHRFSSSSDEEILSADLKLSDALFSVALRYGFSSWKELKRHVESNPAPAAEMRKFWRSLHATLIDGVPMVAALRYVSSSLVDEKNIETVRRVINRVLAGRNLAEAMADSPAVFAPWICGMVQAGEFGGILDITIMGIVRDMDLLSGGKHPAIRQMDAARYWRTLAVLLAAGVPAEKVCAISAKVVSDKRLRSKLIAVGENVEKGMLFSEALRSVGDVFAPEVRDVVTAAETYGTLADEALRIGESLLAGKPELLTADALNVDKQWYNEKRILAGNRKFREMLDEAIDKKADEVLLEPLAEGGRVVCRSDGRSEVLAELDQEIYNTFLGIAQGMPQPGGRMIEPGEWFSSIDLWYRRIRVSVHISLTPWPNPNSCRLRILEYWTSSRPAEK
ncbi:MAG: type II secretion system F family protein [Phycisphaerae bacterium]|nr:type II secretion system F family protein [Phycisphaerae bacterium]